MRQAVVLFSLDPPGNRPEAIEWLLIFFRVTGRKKEIKIGWEGREESVQWWIHQNIRTRKGSWYIQLRSPVFLSCSRPTVCPSDGTTVMLLCHCFFSFPALSSVAGLWPSLFPSTKMTFFSSLLTKISAIRSLIFFCLFWKPFMREPTAKEIRSCNLVFTFNDFREFQCFTLRWATARVWLPHQNRRAPSKARG